MYKKQDGERTTCCCPVHGLRHTSSPCEKTGCDFFKAMLRSLCLQTKVTLAYVFIFTMAKFFVFNFLKH